MAALSTNEAKNAIDNTRVNIHDEEKMSASSKDMEKPAFYNAREVGATLPDGEGIEANPDLYRFSPEQSKRITRKVDFLLLPVIGLLYCISLQDRTNLAAAALAGMRKDLHLVITPTQTVDRYSIITLVFFITYVVFQAPATALIRFFGPRNFLSFLCLSWAAITVGMAFAKTWGPLVGARVLLGVLEAGFFPGVVYLLSTWYVRYDMGKRYAFFYTIGICAAALGGIVAYGVTFLAGTSGLNGWSWIFIVHGLITTVVAIITFVCVMGFPDKNPGSLLGNFLTKDEINHILAKVDADRGDAVAEKFSFKKWLGGGADLKIWGFAFMFGATTTVTYALGFFLPQILNGAMGFSVGASQCLIAPPYFFAMINMLTVSAISDRYKLRAPALVWNSMLCIIGLPVMGFTKTPAVRYFGVFLATAGCNSNIPVIMTYQANNIRGHWKRAFCSATMVGMGGIGGIVGSTVFREKDYPGYRPGLSVAIGANVLIIFVVGLLSLHFTSRNRKQKNEGLVLEGEPNFRYTL